MKMTNLNNVLLLNDLLRKPATCYDEAVHKVEQLLDWFECRYIPTQMSIDKDYVSDCLLELSKYCYSTANFHSDSKNDICSQLTFEDSKLTYLILELDNKLDLQGQYAFYQQDVDVNNYTQNMNIYSKYVGKPKSNLSLLKYFNASDVRYDLSMKLKRTPTADELQKELDLLETNRPTIDDDDYLKFLKQWFMLESGTKGDYNLKIIYSSFGDTTNLKEIDEVVLNWIPKQLMMIYQEVWKYRDIFENNCDTALPDGYENNLRLLSHTFDYFAKRVENDDIIYLKRVPGQTTVTKIE